MSEKENVCNKDRKSIEEIAIAYVTVWVCIQHDCQWLLAYCYGQLPGNTMGLSNIGLILYLHG